MANGTSPDSFELPLNCAHEHWCRNRYGYLDYLPSIPGNAVFLAFFSMAFIAQTILGIRHRTWTFTAAMLAGIFLEVIGYVGRIGMHYDDCYQHLVHHGTPANPHSPLDTPARTIANQTTHQQYLCCLTIAPALFSASIYLSLSRIIAIYGPHLSLLPTRTITHLFITSDLLSLTLQAAGGALASIARTPSARSHGVTVMLVGLSAQVIATTAFSALCLHLAWSIRTHPAHVLTTPASLVAFRHTRRFRLFLSAIALATATILARCAFRVAELAGGFKGALANDEVLFMVFDGAMMALCVLALTGAHPGVTLGQYWTIDTGSGGVGREGEGEGEGEREVGEKGGVV